jgi:hypothetical protein
MNLDQSSRGIGHDGHVAAAWRAPVTRWILLIIAAVCAVGWAWELRPLATQWGNVGEWVGGLGAAGGLFFAAIQIRQASLTRAAEAERREDDEQERREAQARSVALFSLAGERDGKHFVKYRLMNGGDYPIDNVVLVVADPGADYIDLSQQRGTAIELVIGTVLPKEVQEDETEVHFTRLPAFGELNSLAQVLFVDTWNQSWVRGPMLLERTTAPARSC